MVEKIFAACSVDDGLCIGGNKISQSALGVENAALSEHIKGFDGGVDVDLQQNAVVANAGDSFVGLILAGHNLIHESLRDLEIDRLAFAEFHNGVSSVLSSPGLESDAAVNNDIGVFEHTIGDPNTTYNPKCMQKISDATEPKVVEYYGFRGDVA